MFDCMFRINSMLISSLDTLEFLLISKIVSYGYILLVLKLGVVTVASSMLCAYYVYAKTLALMFKTVPTFTLILLHELM